MSASHRTTIAGSTPSVLEAATGGLAFPVLAWGPEGGRPIILLHGFPQEPSIWTPIAIALVRDGFRALAPWQRGYAETTRPHDPSEYSFSRFAEDVIGIADALGLQDFDLVGFGMGGAQAWLASARYPHRVRSLTSLRFPHPAAFALGVRSDREQGDKWRRLEEEFGLGDPRQRAARMLANCASGLYRFLTAVGLPQPYLDIYVERLREPAALAGALAWEHAVNLNEFIATPSICAPTLLIWSEGPGVARTSVITTRSYVSAPYREHLIPNVGNFILESVPECVLDPLRAHLLFA